MSAYSPGWPYHGGGRRPVKALAHELGARGPPCRRGVDMAPPRGCARAGAHTLAARRPPSVTFHHAPTLPTLKSFRAVVPLSRAPGRDRTFYRQRRHRPRVISALSVLSAVLLRGPGSGSPARRRPNAWPRVCRACSGVCSAGTRARLSHLHPMLFVPRLSAHGRATSQQVVCHCLCVERVPARLASGGRCIDHHTICRAGIRAPPR